MLLFIPRRAAMSEMPNSRLLESKQLRDLDGVVDGSDHLAPPFCTLYYRQCATFDSAQPNKPFILSEKAMKMVTRANITSARTAYPASTTGSPALAMMRRNRRSPSIRPRTRAIRAPTRNCGRQDGPTTCMYVAATGSRKERAMSTRLFWTCSAPDVTLTTTGTKAAQKIAVVFDTVPGP